MNSTMEIVGKLYEQKKARLNESWPPILNSLPKYGKDEIRKALYMKGIDIENTPYEDVEITSARDPRIKDKNVILIFKVGSDIVPGLGSKVAVWMDGKFIVDAKVYLDRDFVYYSKISWKKIFEISEKIIMIKFDEEINKALKDKVAARKEAQSGMVKRYTQKDLDKMPYRQRRHLGSLDKSGYEFDPKKYEKMLAELQLDNITPILQKAKDTYLALANNITDMDWENDRGYYDYEALLRQFPSQFRNLDRVYKEYQAAEKARKTEDYEFENWYKTSLRDTIREMKKLIREAQKYLK